MKRLDRKLWLLLGLLLFLAMVAVIYLLTRSELEKKVMTCHKYYASIWKLNYVQEDKKNKKITVSFDLKGGKQANQLTSITETYQSLVTAIFGSSDSIHNDYTIEIYFSDSSSGECFFMHNIRKNINSIEINSSKYFELKDLANAFPYTTQLSLTPALYEDISEIKGFNNLRYVYFSQGITLEEKQYILSLYPNCEIDEQGDLQEV